MENTTILHQKYIKKFICEKCDFSCCKKGDFTRHLQSKKHNTTNTTKIQPKKPQFRCKCGKLYIHRASLHNHQKVCEVENENLEKNKKKKKKKKNFSENIEIIDSSNNHLLQTTLQENNELRQMLIDQQKQISELIPKVGSNNNNSINMNIFLNEQCKDALNMTDFINSIQLKIEDMELFGTDGYVNGMSNIFLKYLSGMDVTKRPVHCSDLIKETLYIKDENKWDKEKDKLSEAFRKVTKKGLTVIADNEDPEQNHVIMQELFHTEDNKVIKEIAKETYIPGNASSNE
jgi:hypothetical protein